VFGGLLLEQFWWGSAFLLGVPAMAALLVLGPLVLSESRDDDAGRLDVVSVILSLAAVLAVIFGLKRIVDSGFGGLSIVAIAAGVVTGVVFVLRQRTLPDPLIDLRLFRAPVFSTALTIQSVALLAWAGSYFYLAQYLQIVAGLSPFAAGLWLVPAACGSVLGSMLAPAFVARVSPGVVLAVALALAAAGFAILAFADGSGLAVAVIGSVIFSLGVAPTVTLGTDLIVGAASPERAGAAAGISETGTELGMALGIAAIGSIGTAVYRSQLRMPNDAPPWAVDVARGSVGGAQAMAGQLPDPLASEVLDAASTAFIRAVQVTAATSAAVAAALIPLALVLLPRGPGRPGRG
jgi:MFS transporter, DHA2 family, multidrug resistance protein